jgi:hypothetical protein
MKFYLHSYVAPDGNSVMLRCFDIRIGGHFRYSTGLKVQKKSWDAGRQRPKRGYGYDDIINALDGVEGTVNSYLNGDNVSRDELTILLKTMNIGEGPVKAPESIPMLQAWEAYLISSKSRLTPGSYRAYRRSMEIFQEFLTERHKQAMTTKGFNYSMYIEYSGWLLEKYAFNQHAKTIKRLGTFAKYAVKLKYEFGMDLSDLKYKEIPGRKIYMKTDQVKKLIELELKDRLDRIRDLMVIHCLTGVRISDLFRINSSIIVDGRLHIRQQKTNKTIIIPVFKSVQAVLDKYKGNPPKYSEKEYREGIKDVYKLIDPDGMIELRESNKVTQVPIYKEISSHDMIRTFVRFANDNGISVAAISKITGKTIKVLLTHYLTDDVDSALREFDKIDI